MYKIESNIPINYDTHQEREQYPFAQMQVGDSFSVPADRFLSARTSAYQYGQRHGLKFVSSKTALRVWRVA